MTLLQKIQALAATEARATKGPWRSDRAAIIECEDRQDPDTASRIADATWYDKNAQANAALIADSRNMLPALLALVEAQRKALEIGDSLQKPGDIWSVQPDRMRAFQVASKAALALGNQEHP